MGALSDAVRRRSATIGPSKGYPTGRFPINDRKHARLALADLGRANGLTAAQKAQIRARARRRLGA